MKPVLPILALAVLAVLAHAQTPTTVYAQANRMPHKDNVAGFTNDSGVPHDYDLNLSQGDFFRVEGDAEQNLPWGLNWQNLCDNTWTYSQPVHFHLDPDWGFIQIDDYYTIDKGCVDPATGENDSSNGDDIIVAGTTTWVRTCTALVTNSITYKTVSTIADEPPTTLPTDPRDPSGGY